MSTKQMSTISKLFKLKKWLTIPDTARHLSIMFEEDVNEADVLRLALDGHLKLSVDFVNHTKARAVEFTTTNIDDEVKELRSYLDGKSESKIARFCPEEVLEKLEVMQKDGLRQLKRCSPTDNKISSLSGIWNLSMIGSERLDVEHQYQMLTGGPEVTLTTLDGTFVDGENGEFFQLLERLDRKVYLTEQDRSEKYFPADHLPTDSVLVVRTQSIVDLLDNFSNNEPRNGYENRVDINYSFNDSSHPFFANELKIVVEAWRELYEKNPPQCVPPGGHKKYIIKWLQENHPTLGQRALERIATVINPNPRGGASPILDCR